MKKVSRTSLPFFTQLLTKDAQGAWIVNTARGAICNAEDIAEALKSGHIAGCQSAPGRSCLQC